MIEPVRVLAGDPSVQSPGVVVIAAGTRWETLVRDVRGWREWARPTRERYTKEERSIIYHHTASDIPHSRSTHQETQFLLRLATYSPFGVPYNFVVMPGGNHRIYYVNDVDWCWPHTLGHNCGTAICAVGNYSVLTPRPTLVPRMLRLADALATMWQRWVPEMLHRDVYATECPGNNLAPLLSEKLSYRASQV